MMIKKNKMDLIKNSIKVKTSIPTKDLSEWERESQEITVSTEFNPKNNQFKFRLRIPTHVFDEVKNTEEKYYTNPPAPKESWKTKPKKFTQNLSDITLTGVLKQLSDVCIDALQIKERDDSETEKYIAIKFKQSNFQKKDMFNFADMGKETVSSFQFFIVYKIINPNLLSRFRFKSNKKIDSMNRINSGSTRKGVWAYFGFCVDEDYQLIRWTKEREDFLKSVQEKFVNMNEELEKYLGEINDDKIIALMNNSQFLLK